MNKGSYGSPSSPNLIDLSSGSSIDEVSSSLLPNPTIESSGDSHIVESLYQCMFSSSSSHEHLPVDEDEIEFLGETGPGRSSTDPIVLSDSPQRYSESPATSSNVGGQLSSPGMLQVDVVSGQYPPCPYFPPHLFAMNSPTPPGGMGPAASATASASVSTVYHIPNSFPYHSYQIRLSIPPPMTLVRPTPVYRPTPLHPPGPSSSFLHWPLDADSFLENATGASQRLIEECTQKTRFIKRMPSSNKLVNAKRQAPKCPICLEEFVDKVKIRRLRCIHNFHVKCIDQWLKKNMICPVCRKSIISR